MSAPILTPPGTTGGGPPVGGSGTIGTIPKWATTTTLGDSVITESAGNIGIGVAIPGSKLAAAGSIDSRSGSNTGSYLIGGSTALSASSGALLSINSGNFTNVNIVSGNVGIGTASPFGKLDVAGTTVNSSVVNIDGSLYNGSGNASNNVGFQFFAQNSSSARTQYGAINMLNQISTAGTEKGRMRFFVANSGDGASNEAMSILGSNVGIGTTSPGCALDVVGVMKTSGYTVGALPAGAIGRRAYVTDATAPTYLGALVGGGAVVAPVFHNGTAWVSA